MRSEIAPPPSAAEIEKPRRSAIGCDVSLRQILTSNSDRKLRSRPGLWASDKTDGCYYTTSPSP